MGGTLPGCGAGPRTRGGLTSVCRAGVNCSRGPAAGGVGLGAGGRGPGQRSAAVVDPEALDNLLAAQRASAQRLAALRAAADVATVEEDHLRLRGESRSVWAPPPTWPWSSRPSQLLRGQ